MARLLAMAYGAVAYVAFLLSFLYAIAFVGNLPQTVPALAPWVPRTIDGGGPAGGLIAALIVNGLLMPVRGPAHCYGAPGVQVSLDPDRAGAHRTKYIRATFLSDFVSALLAMAPDDRHGLEHAAGHARECAAQCALLVRLAVRTLVDFHDRSLPSVRSETGLDIGG